MKKNLLASTASMCLALAVSSPVLADGHGVDLTLCWAAWDPANALVELSRDFEEQSGHNMNFEFVPWPNFADRMLNELNSGGGLCDLMIGDSQWIGGGAEQGHYVQLNDFFDANGISMDDFIPATVTGYSEWPKGTPNYWALPAFGDVVGWTYRRDWFEREDIRAAFSAEYGRELGVPQTLDELRDIAQFFQGREIDGTTVYGAAIYTERGSEGITMGVTNALYNYGFEYENPDQPYDLEGFVNSEGAIAGLEFYRDLYETATPPGSSNWYMGENIDAYKSGQVAMQMNFAFIWPGVNADPNVGGDRSGYFPNPAGPAGQFAQLGGQGISVVSYSDNQDAALEYIQWFAQPEVQARWWELGGYSALNAVVEDPDFASSQPYAQTFLDSMAIVKDFWADPAYAELLLAMQARVHNYVVAGEGTAEEALDGLVGDWVEVFEDEGKL
ncbi:ABC transporter substrate-binding protein [Pontivivens insulae]|uniref:Putative ABC transporter-binding protein n=1 Tax=Pontivivens insulae TaxID=1639689 RepID=A0A2R8AGK7_9RHOB|nr:ABC transporter substrate-binding protein [Pontivivens insulae]RED10614.1 carbohydrate ABC transporter substrate-binding protein (CUT1 family) [Pontivivens insulae]SPF31175.1 putative ABC transporter-binding protein [Pontivivens insulae]